VSDDELATAVRDLINRSLPSMDHVELLLLLRSEFDAEHEPATLAGRARMSEATAQRVVDDLIASGLAERSLSGGIKRTAHDEEAVAALAEAYHYRPVTLVRAVYARPSTITSFGTSIGRRENDAM
jgi:hypothetical protein